MPREAEPSLNERIFILQALRENIRLDGRAFNSFRDMELSFGDEYGVADVRLGKTRYAKNLLLPTFLYHCQVRRHIQSAPSHHHPTYLVPHAN